MSSRKPAVGIAWYLPGDYDRARALMTDAGSLPDTFEQWLALAENAERAATASGNRIVRAILDPFEFPIWCRDNGVAPDGAGRARFASWVAAHEDTGYG